MASIPELAKNLQRLRLSRSVLLVALAPALAAVLVLAAFDVFLPAHKLAFLGVAYGLVVMALSAVVSSLWGRLEHDRAVRSMNVLAISNDTLPHFRKGLSVESASAVARILFDRSDAIAVAITDGRDVLGFAGAGEDHHVVGGPLLTSATRESLHINRPVVVSSRSDIGCPEPSCPLSSAIVVPLEQKGQAVGTLKFYYDAPEMLTESRIVVAEGLARLLSTQLALSEVEKQQQLATSAELKALQAQVNPHFLFNTLNTIGMLCRTDPVRARTLIIEFAHFFRQSLEHADDLVPLRRELDYIHSYLVFERARFGKKLVVEESVDPSLEDLIIPAFTVQPLVENAVKHALREDGSLAVRVEVARDNGQARIQVRDNGVGIPPNDLPRVMMPGFGKGIGIGLANVDQRLRGMFGPDHGLRIDSTLGEGTTVTMIVPVGGDR